MVGLRVEPHAKLSGDCCGENNYYHFLIDFAVKVFNECGVFEPANESGGLERRCMIYVRRGEGYNFNESLGYAKNESVFHAVTGQTMRRHFLHIFGTRLQFKHVSSAADLPRDAASLSFRRYIVDGRPCRQTRALTWTVFSDECDEWSRQPPGYFWRFRRSVLSDALASPQYNTGRQQSVPTSRDAVLALANPGVLVLLRTSNTTARLYDRTITSALRHSLQAWAAEVNASHRLHFLEVDTTWSVTQQAKLFASARVVVANHGAGCSNIVFCAPGAHFVELHPILYSCYANLARRAGVSYHVSSQANATTLLRSIWPRAGHGARHDAPPGTQRDVQHRAPMHARVVAPSHMLQPSAHASAVDEPTGHATVVDESFVDTSDLVDDELFPYVPYSLLAERNKSKILLLLVVALYALFPCIRLGLRAAKDCW